MFSIIRNQNKKKQGNIQFYRLEFRFFSLSHFEDKIKSKLNISNC